MPFKGSLLQCLLKAYPFQRLVKARYLMPLEGSLFDAF
jgi:hypothetical protein